MYDLVLKNGTVVDGTGAPSFRADIGVVGDRIAAVGQIDQREGALDLNGRLVTPGFIDPHSHADCSAFLYPDCESYLRQGITTFVGGQCGDSNAPIHRYWMRKYWEYDFWDAIDPFVFSQTTIQPTAKVVAGLRQKAGIEIDWRSFRDYHDKLTRLGLGCNMVALLGHSQIRADVMGLDQNRPPSAAELAAMKAYIDEAVDCGVWGLSTGRDYPPSAYASVGEIVELLTHMKASGGMYFTHWRRTGVRAGTPQRPDKLAGITEALEIALAAGVKVQVSHLTTGFEIYPPDPRMDTHAAEVTLAVFDDYLRRGAEAAFDVIPGRSGGIAISPYLAAYLMPWLRQAGSLAGFVRNLSAADYRAYLAALLERGEWYALNPRVNPNWDRQLRVIESRVPAYVGASVRELAADLRLSPVEAVFALLMADPHLCVQDERKTDEEVRALLAHRLASPCTDTYAFDLTGTYGRDMEIPEILPHPNTYCAFPKYLLEYPAATLEETIRKMTGAVARFMDIPGRGEIRSGHYADLVVLDPDRLRTNENLVEPRVYPSGIDYVFVNGVQAVGPAGFTGRRAGSILKRRG